MFGLLQADALWENSFVCTNVGKVQDRFKGIPILYPTAPPSPEPQPNMTRCFASVIHVFQREARLEPVCVALHFTGDAQHFSERGPSQWPSCAEYSCSAATLSVALCLLSDGTTPPYLCTCALPKAFDPFLWYTGKLTCSQEKNKPGRTGVIISGT